MIERAIVAKLLENAGVFAAVQRRIYPVEAAQDSPAPFITYQRISGEHAHHMERASGLCICRLQIDAWAEQYSDCREVGEAVRLALDGFRGRVGVDDIRMCHLIGERGLSEPPSFGGDESLHRWSMDFRIAYREPVTVFA